MASSSSGIPFVIISAIDCANVRNGGRTSVRCRVVSEKGSLINDPTIDDRQAHLLHPRPKRSLGMTQSNLDSLETTTIS